MSPTPLFFFSYWGKQSFLPLGNILIKSERSYNKCKKDQRPLNPIFHTETAHFQVPLFQKQQDNSIIKVFIWF